MGIFTLYTSDDCPAPRLMIVECPPLAGRLAPSISRRIGPCTIEPTAALRASVRRHRSSLSGLRSVMRGSFPKVQRGARDPTARLIEGLLVFAHDLPESRSGEGSDVPSLGNPMLTRSPRR